MVSGHLQAAASLPAKCPQYLLIMRTDHFQRVYGEGMYTYLRVPVEFWKPEYRFYWLNSPRRTSLKLTSHSKQKRERTLWLRCFSSTVCAGNIKVSFFSKSDCLLSYCTYSYFPLSNFTFSFLFLLHATESQYIPYPQDTRIDNNDSSFHVVWSFILQKITWNI
jgi:hypothetical protein